MVMQDSPIFLGNTNANIPIATRPVIRGTQGMVSAGHYLTTMSAVRMLLSGGNAFDAAVAAGFTAAVLEPIAHYSLAAEGVFMLYHAGNRQLRALSGQGVAARKATVGAFKQKGYDKIPTGPGPDAGLSFTVPGVVDAFLLLLQDYGTKTVAETLAPAIEYAQRGFPMYPMMRDRLQNPGSLQQFTQFPPGPTEVLYQNGLPLPVGRIVVQKQLGEPMLKLVHAESEARGTGRLVSELPETSSTVVSLPIPLSIARNGSGACSVWMTSIATMPSSKSLWRLCLWGTRFVDSPHGLKQRCCCSP